MDKSSSLIKTLLEQDEEFRKLFDEHKLLEKKLADFDKYHYLSTKQEMERKKLQKIKLRGRDRMEEIIKRQERVSG